MNVKTSTVVSAGIGASTCPDVNDWQLGPHRFRRKIVAENLPQQSVHDRMEALFSETVPVRLGLPHVEIAQPTLRPSDCYVQDQPVGEVLA